MRLSFPMFRANRHILTLICALGFALSGTAQQLDVPKMDYGYPKEYTIGGLTAVSYTHLTLPTSDLV